MSTFILPYPPSNNVFYRHNRGRTHISAEGVAYKAAAASEFRRQGGRMTEGRVAVEGRVTAPDRRRRDLDNLYKALLDSLKGVAYTDDSEIFSLGPLAWVLDMVGKKVVQKGGQIELSVSPL